MIMIDGSITPSVTNHYQNERESIKSEAERRERSEKCGVVHWRER